MIARRRVKEKGHAGWMSTQDKVKARKLAREREQAQAEAEERARLLKANNSGQITMQQFGTHLEDLCMSKEAQNGIPPIVRHVCQWVEENALQVVGVWGLAGDPELTSTLQERFDKGIFQLESNLEVGSVTALVVSWLNKLPEGLLTAADCDALIAAGSTRKTAGGGQEAAKQLNRMLDVMGEHRRNTLRFLIHHFRRVVAFSHFQSCYVWSLFLHSFLARNLDS